MKNIFIVLSIFILLGCQNNEKCTEKMPNTYEVLTVLFDDLLSSHIKYMVFPPSPPPPLLNSEDYTFNILEKVNSDNEIIKDTVNEIKKYIKKYGKSIVAIDTVLEPPYYTKEINESYIKDCLELGFSDVYTSFENLNDSMHIDVSQVTMNEYSYVLPYMSYYKDMPRRGFDKYDVILKFSRISFNNDYTKAIVIMGASFGRLNGFSAIYFLEKSSGIWRIKCEKGLTIS